MSEYHEFIDGQYLVIMHDKGIGLFTRKHLIIKEGDKYHKYKRKPFINQDVTKSNRKLFIQIVSKTNGEQIYICNGTDKAWSLLDNLMGKN